MADQSERLARILSEGEPMIPTPPTYQARLESDSQRRIAAAEASLQPHASVCSSSDGHVVLAVTDTAGRMSVLRMTPDAARDLVNSLIRIVQDLEQL